MVNGEDSGIAPLLPTERDFVPHDEDLDAQCAWQNFGGLTLDEANRKFREAPESYQEDFMFMGGKAFAFYYPVIDGFLRETPEIPEDERYDRRAWILAHCIANQFERSTLPHVRHLKNEILDLAGFVRRNIALFGESGDELDVDVAWEQLERRLGDLEE
jgi:hypothetical protein